MAEATSYNRIAVPIRFLADPFLGSFKPRPNGIVVLW
jgi:hypothetical protein